MIPMTWLIVMNMMCVCVCVCARVPKGWGSGAGKEPVSLGEKQNLDFVWVSAACRDDWQSQWTVWATAGHGQQLSFKALTDSMRSPKETERNGAFPYTCAGLAWLGLILHNRTAWQRLTFFYVCPELKMQRSWEVVEGSTVNILPCAYKA